VGELPSHGHTASTDTININGGFRLDGTEIGVLLLQAEYFLLVPVLHLVKVMVTVEVVVMLVEILILIPLIAIK
ncbi:hypothetical protein, partial [Megamonas funiformis]|uniref:hypothetical protein n=1 Tax=Megamonas funiformis TaxID=437897 RepID=UPI0022E25059